MLAFGRNLRKYEMNDFYSSNLHWITLLSRFYIQLFWTIIRIFSATGTQTCLKTDNPLSQYSSMFLEDIRQKGYSRKNHKNTHKTGYVKSLNEIEYV